MLVSYQDSIFGIDWFANASEMALTLFTKLNYSQCQHSAKDFQEMGYIWSSSQCLQYKVPNFFSNCLIIGTAAQFDLHCLSGRKFQTPGFPQMTKSLNQARYSVCRLAVHDDGIVK